MLFHLLQYVKSFLSLHSFSGFVAEWLGRGLQNLVQRFESARNLKADKSLRQTVLKLFFIDECGNDEFGNEMRGSTNFECFWLIVYQLFTNLNEVFIQIETGTITKLGTKN
jgi:hypothetical protein